MQVKKGDKVMLSLEKAGKSQYDLAIAGIEMDNLQEGRVYTVTNKTRLLQKFPAVQLQDKMYWHPIDIFTIKNEKMKESKFQKGDIVRRRGTHYTYTVAAIDSNGNLGFVDQINWHDPDDYELVDDSTSLREGDEVYALTYDNPKAGFAVDKDEKYRIHTVSSDGKYITLVGKGGMMYSSSLFKKVKPKKTEEKITIGIGTKVRELTITKTMVHFKEGGIAIDDVERAYNQFSTSVLTSTFHFQIVDRDTRSILVGCESQDVRVSLIELKRVLNIAKGLD